jgi:exopolysaccharide biosynthesis polyprenyl glycosylphosphotransferase
LLPLLVATDAVGALAVWEIVVVSGHVGDSWVARLAPSAPLALTLTIIAIITNRVQKLYLARACSVRSAEITGLARTSFVCAIAALGLSRPLGQSVPTSTAIVGAVVALVTAAALRGVYSRWLRNARLSGRFTREVCVIGTNEEANDLVHLFDEQPELGYRVVGVIGSRREWVRRDSEVPVIGEIDNAVERVLSAGTPGAVIALSALGAGTLDRTIRGLADAGIHVQVSTGLARIGQRRLRPAPVSHHLLFYVERHQLSRWQADAKRAMDIVLASLALALAAPVLIAVAVAIKFCDRGPVFFRQERVGRDGRLFRVVKFRTMVVGAASQVDGLAALNERNGPLFKLSFDPRVTRVGRILRATSIDELPQLLNVIEGTMSLVGPRPALPREAEQFDPELVERASVAPGITGLWQVEARDNPSFRAYRRLDLFYVDNWSLTMDLAILAGTLPVVLERAVGALRRRAEMMGRSAQAHNRDVSAAPAAGPFAAVGHRSAAVDGGTSR